MLDPVVKVLTVGSMRSAMGSAATVSFWATVDRLAHAYTTGEGIGWHEQDPRLFPAVDRFFRPLYRNSLIDGWLPAVDGLVDRLHDGIRVLDVAAASAPRHY